MEPPRCSDVLSVSGSCTPAALCGGVAGVALTGATQAAQKTLLWFTWLRLNLSKGLMGATHTLSTVRSTDCCWWGLPLLGVRGVVAARSLLRHRSGLWEVSVVVVLCWVLLLTLQATRHLLPLLNFSS